MRRRDFLLSMGLVVAAGSALGACESSTGDLPHVADAEQNDLVARMLQDDPFFIAHRGSGDDYPEHTMIAYESVVAAGAAAIEVSVVMTADGVPVCGHDLTVDRVTGGKGTGRYSDYELDELQAVPVDMSRWLGPGWPPVPHCPLKDVLDRFLGQVVIFIEPKAGAAHDAVMEMLDGYPEPQRSVVYKAHKWGGYQADARRRGYRVWSFVDEDTPLSEIEDIAAAGAGLLGLPYRDDISSFPHTADEKIESVVALGKPVICWEIHRRWSVDHLSSLGVRGMMCSGFNYVAATRPRTAEDSFATNKRPPGDLPKTHAVSEQPAWDGDELVLDKRFAGGYLLGSMSWIRPPRSYSIRFDVSFDTVPADPDLHAGIAFGRQDDSAFVAFAPQRSGGYHVVLRADGRLQLYRHDPNPNEWVSEQLASAADDPPRDGEFRRYEVTASPGRLTLQRIDGAPSKQISATDRAYRGGYLHVCRNWELGDGAVRFRNVGASSPS